MSGLPPDQEAARTELHDFLTRHADTIGPVDYEDEDIDPPDTVFLDSWNLVCSWTDADGESWLTQMGSRGSADYQRMGLLHAGLRMFG